MERFLLADDHSIVRAGVRAIILEDFPRAHIDEAADNTQVSEFIKSNQYNLIVLDINLPDSDFVSTIRWINTVSPATRILILTMHTENTYGVRAIQSGAHGFINKAASSGEIALAIKKVLANNRYISTDLAELLIENYSENKPANPFNSLSEREMEICILLHKGQSLPAAAQSLHIDYSTANTYKRRIFEKLKVDNIVSLVHLMNAYGFAEG